MTLTMSPPMIKTTQADIDELILAQWPPQGYWSEETYLQLTDGSNRLIEYTDGYIEVLPMPTEEHQAIIEYLHSIFKAYLATVGGKARFAPLRLRIRSGKFREPDMLLVRNMNDPRRQNSFWLGADLVLEVVSDDDPDRDYAEAGIPEYWIVDPQKQIIIVLRLEEGAYVEHGVFGAGEQATSASLEGFSTDVDAVFSAS